LTKRAREPAPAVVVRGEAMVTTAPDEVEIALDLDAHERTAERASDELARRSGALGQLLDELLVPNDRRATTGIFVHEEREWEKSRLLMKGYRAWTRLTVRLSDFSQLPTIMSRAVERAHADVSGPWWRATEQHPARAEVCRQAAAHARQKAEAYAAALGVDLGPVVRVADPDMGEPAFARAREAMAIAAVAGRDDTAPSTQLEPGTIDLRAAVEVTFRLKP
jgi:uncharacterized protein YggE